MNDDRRCTATAKATGERCKRAAIDGGKVCSKHGGKAPQVKAKAAERLQRAQLDRTARKLGMPADIDAETGLLDMIREAAGNVAFYRALVQELEQGWRLVDTQPDVDDEEAQERELAESLTRPSIAGRIKPGTWEAKPHVLLTLYNEERDRLARYLKDAASLGIAERRVRIAEEHGQNIVAVLRGVLSELGLNEAQRSQVPGLVRRHMEAIAAKAVEVA